MKKTISILGSTGSIGKSTIAVLENSLESYKVIALTAKSDYKTLASQAKLLKPNYVVLSEFDNYQKLKDELLNFPKIKVFFGAHNIEEIAKIKCDISVISIIGLAALKPLISAIKSGSNIGMANKECLVAAGDLIIKEAKENKVKLIPIDSEHNAIFQVFEKDHSSLIDNITLTASGGPFFRKKISELKDITKEQALKHPKWSMGAKISIDSATMMNKALEMIEAHHLFNIKEDKIKVVIHPESIVHGLVDYKDGSTLAMMSMPDMQVPIAYAISYPNRIEIKHQKLDLPKLASLNFYEADENRFEALKLAREVLKIKGNAPCILNAANEIAVERFLKDEIKFIDIIKINMEVLEKVPYSGLNSFDEVFLCDIKSRNIAKNIK